MKTLLIIVLIIVVAAFLRFYKLNSNPPGLYWDEVAHGYSAYSILKTARDEFGTFLPVTFKSYGDYKNPVYIYLLVPTIAIFGLSEFAVRFPSALLGTLTVLLTYFLSKKIFNNQTIAFFGMFFLAISSWHLQFSRAGFEANVMVFFNVLAVILFLYSFKNYKYLILSAICFGLAFNTYHGAKLWTPLLLMALTLIYNKEILKFGKKLFIPIILLLILILPTLLTYQSSLSRGKTVSILTKPNSINIFFAGYLSHFSPNFLFLEGDNQGRHTPNGTGPLYIFQIPFIAFGLMYLIKKRTKESKFMLLWLILSPIPSAIAEPTPHTLRFITSLPLWSIFTAIGVVVFFRTIKNKAVFTIGGIIMFIIFSYNLLTYFHLYYIHYPKEKGPDWQVGYKEMVNYVNKNQHKYDTVGIANFLGEPYMYILFYTQYDPKKYQSLPKGELNSFDRYRFIKGASGYLENSGKVMIVTAPNDGNQKQTLKMIYANSTEVFRISEQ